MVNYNFYIIPTSLKWVMFLNQNEYILLYNNTITSIIYLPKHNYTNQYSKSIQIPKHTSTFENSLAKILQDVSLVKLILLKFKGKGFRLIKNANKLNLLFNFAHLKYLVPQKIVTEKIAKIKIILVTSNRYELRLVANSIRYVRSIDQYTKNGIRFKRQLVSRRKGKTLTI